MKITAKQFLDLIEGIVGDDFLEDLGMHVAGDGANPTEYERKAYAKLSAAYRAVHSLNKRHSCHSVHKGWRKQVFKLLKLNAREDKTP